MHSLLLKPIYFERRHKPIQGYDMLFMNICDISAVYTKFYDNMSDLNHSEIRISLNNTYDICDIDDVLSFFTLSELYLDWTKTYHQCYHIEFDSYYRIESMIHTLTLKVNGIARDCNLDRYVDDYYEMITMEKLNG